MPQHIPARNIKANDEGINLTQDVTSVNFTGAGVTATDDGQGNISVNITGGGAGSGESNTASNSGLTGVGLVLTKVGVDLPFKAIDAGSNKITVTNDATNKTIDIDVAEANLTLGNLGGSIDLGGSKASGTLAGSRFPALTGDVTTSAGFLATTIANDAVTFAKMQNISTGVLLGRSTASTGDIETISVGSGLSLSGGTLTASGSSGEANTASNAGLTGVGLVLTKSGVDLPFKSIAANSSKIAVTNDAGNSAVNIDVTEANLTLGNLGGSINLGGTQASGTLAADRFPALTGDVTTTAGSLSTTIANDAITYAKIQNVSATDRLLGRSTSGAGDIEEITCTAAGRALLDDANASAQRTTLGLGTAATMAGPGGAIVGTTDTQTLTNKTIDAASNTLSNIGTTSLSNGAVTYAKIQNVSATQRVLGRNTAGAGVAEEVTASQVFDWIGSTRGSILFRGASGWSVLTPGTSGHVLTSNGSGADPSYQAAGGGGGGTSLGLTLSAALGFTNAFAF